MKRRRWGIVTFIFLLMAGCSPTLPSSAPSSAPSVPVSPSAAAPSLGPSVSATLRPPESPAPTAQPGVVLAGVFPLPDATIPPGAPAIPGLRIEAIAAAAGAEGLTCVSEAGTYQDGSGGYTLGCEGQDVVGHATFTLSVTYWSLDGISEIYLAVRSDGFGRLSSAAPIEMFSAISALASGELAKSWVVAHLDDQACGPSCVRTYGSVRLELQVGVNGARALHVFGEPR